MIAPSLRRPDIRAVHVICLPEIANTFKRSHTHPSNGICFFDHSRFCNSKTDSVCSTAYKLTVRAIGLKYPMTVTPCPLEARHLSLRVLGIYNRSAGGWVTGSTLSENNSLAVSLYSIHSWH